MLNEDTAQRPSHSATLIYTHPPCNASHLATHGLATLALSTLQSPHKATHEATHALADRSGFPPCPCNATHIHPAMPPYGGGNAPLAAARGRTCRACRRFLSLAAAAAARSFCAPRSRSGTNVSPPTRSQTARVSPPYSPVPSPARYARCPLPFARYARCPKGAAGCTYPLLRSRLSG